MKCAHTQSRASEWIERASERARASEERRVLNAKKFDYTFTGQTVRFKVIYTMYLLLGVRTSSKYMRIAARRRRHWRWFRTAYTRLYKYIYVDGKLCLTQTRALISYILSSLTSVYIRGKVALTLQPWPDFLVFGIHYNMNTRRKKKKRQACLRHDVPQEA